MLSGSAPIHPEVIETFGKVMGCSFVEAFGQTEGGAFMQNLDDRQFGNIGVIWVLILLLSRAYSSN
jgi:long-subunit acyl-CoA synthetase (AMP-forming)